MRDGRVDLSPDNFTWDPRFKLHVPRSVPGVDDRLLDPRNAWGDLSAYEAAADKLARIFRDHADTVPDLPDSVRAACPEALG